MNNPPASCTLHSSWSFDSAHCLSFPTPSTHTEFLPWIIPESGLETVTKTTVFAHLSRYITSTIAGNSTILVSATTTDYNRCLPGPQYCFNYSLNLDGRPTELCPSPYVGISTQINQYSTTLACCLAVSGGTPRYSSTRPYTSGIRTVNQIQELCVQSWQLESGLSATLSIPLFHVYVAATPTLSTPSTSAISPLSSAHNGSTTQLPNNTATNIPPSTSLHNSTKIGIGVGVSLGVLTLISTIAVVFYVLRRRKQRKKAELAHILEQKHNMFDNKQELDGNFVAEMDGQTQAEAGGLSVMEMEGSTRAGELMGEGSVFELMGTGVAVEAGGEEARVRDTDSVSGERE